MRDTIEMAREAAGGLLSYDEEDQWYLSASEVLRLVELVRADEREACAKVCEDQKYMILEPLKTYSARDVCDANKRTALYLSKAIRARGEK